MEKFAVKYALGMCSREVRKGVFDMGHFHTLDQYLHWYWSFWSDDMGEQREKQP